MLNIARKAVAVLPEKKKLLIISIVAVVLICVILVLISIMQPQRTVTNFCQVAKEEGPHFKADTSPAVLLNVFKRIDAVSPDVIHPDTSVVVKGYQSIVDDPSKAIASELGMASSQLKVSDYIVKSCTGY